MQYTYLCHYGVKGQKWGQRRYQNEDGTLTEEGKARYGDGEEGVNRYEADAAERDAYRKSQRNQKIAIGVGSALIAGALAGLGVAYMKTKKKKHVKKPSADGVKKAASRGRTIIQQIFNNNGGGTMNINDIAGIRHDAIDDDDPITYLQHAGIKGQKWGQRRYRNYDGTLTEEGKQRYNYSDDQKAYDENNKKDYRELSNKELTDLKTRRQLIGEYKEAHPNKYNKAKSKIDTAVGYATGALVTVGAMYAIYESGKSIIDHFRGVTDADGNRVKMKFPSGGKKK